MLFYHEKIHVIDKLLFDYIDELILKKDFYKYLKVITLFKKKKFPLTGEDLKSIGFKSGEKLGITLDKITNWWIMSDFKENKKSCMKYAQKLL